jgi:hypothetical protein
MSSQDSKNMMEQENEVIDAGLKTPRAAAIAGIVFSILFIIILVILRRSVPADPHEAGTWLSSRWKSVDLALHLIPFAGIAFLWFIAVMRDRLGEHEDRFFSTTFLASGLLFVAMLFCFSAVAGAIMMVYGQSPEKLLESGIYSFGRALVYQFMQVYGMKMAGMFMFLTSTLSLRTGIIPRWMALLGYPLALSQILLIGFFHLLPLLFPLWVLMISVYILFTNFTGSSDRK